MTGTPTTAGPYSFTITATDGMGCEVSQAYTILIYVFMASVDDIPTLSGWAMIMLIAVLGLLGFAAIRRLAA